MEQPLDEVVLTESDIVFECPHCGKSLAIEDRGAGMIVTCPDCRARVQVPGIADTSPRPHTSRVGQAELDQLLSENMDHMELIGQELGVIQAAIDRIVAILQNSAAEKSSRR
jgi:hypothetical protein